MVLVKVFKYLIHLIDLLFVVVVWLGISFVSAAEPDSKTAQVCIDHYPPLQVVKSNGQVDGHNAELVELIAKHVGVRINYKTDIPFTRCLNCMRSGDCDLMVGLLDVDDRRDYMELFQYSGRSDKVFYTRANPKHMINQYEDLAGLTVGVNHGYRYFDSFDNESKLFDKVYVDTLEQLFRMLISKRVDVIICSVTVCEAVIEQQPEWRNKVTLTAYSYTAENKTYLGLSKKSRLNIDKKQLAAVVNELFLNGEVAKIFAQSEVPDSNKTTSPKN